MSNAVDVLLFVKGEESQTPSPVAPPPASGLIRWRWWLLVVANIFFLLVGQTVATLLGRLYYNEGGSSQWMTTLAQSAGFPVLFIPLVLLLARRPASASGAPARTLAAICLGLGLYSTGNSLMYTYGLRYIPVSTFSLISATQLAFNVVFSYFLNGQKFTALIINSAVTVTFLAAISGVSSDDSASCLDPLTLRPHSYTYLGTAVARQVSSVGSVFVVSSLFSNVVDTVALPMVPIFAVVFFGDKMDDLKVITLLMTIWGFACYVYQQFLDEKKTKNAITATADDAEWTFRFLVTHPA